MVDSLAVRKAVVPLAGLGTRLLPATKAVAKAMLPIVDKPVVQYVAEEAATAGLTEMVLVTGANDQALRAHFEPAPELEAWLAARGQDDALANLRSASGFPEVSYIHQDVPRGLGDAVLRCADRIGDEPFAVLFGDNIVDPRQEILSRLLSARRQLGGTILALIQTPPDQVSSRGVVAFEPTDDPEIVRITDIVEKPAPSRAPSNWIMIGRCVCDPAIFAVLRETPAGYGGEIQLSDALRTLADLDAEDGGGVHGVLWRGRRFDTGNKQDYVRTTVEVACARPDIAEDFAAWLRQFAGTLEL